MDTRRQIVCVMTKPCVRRSATSKERRVPSNDLQSLDRDHIKARMQELDEQFLTPSRTEGEALALLLEYMELDHELDHPTHVSGAEDDRPDEA